MPNPCRIPKYREIINRIRTDIAEGVLPPGTRLPVREELITQYQVTRTTIDRALSELIRSGDLVASRRNGTFVANGPEEKIAIVTWKESVLHHRALWGETGNFFSMYGRLFEQLDASLYEVISPDRVLKSPDLLRRFRRILINSVSAEEFEDLAMAVGDRSRFLLLNREFPDCDFIGTDHRQAAFDLTELFLSRLPHAETVVFLDMPGARNLSSRDLWDMRRQGFVDACEKYRRFYRILCFRQDCFEENVALLKQYVGENRTTEAPGVVISPTRAMMGCVLGFLFATGGRLNREIFYGDFDNDRSLLDYGQPIPSVVQNFSGIADLAIQHWQEQGVRIHVPYSIVHSPWAEQ